MPKNHSSHYENIQKKEVDELGTVLKTLLLKLETGLDAPAMTVAVKYDDGKKEERVSFGKSDTDAYAGRPGEPGAAKIDATDFNEAVKTLDEIAKP